VRNRSHKALRTRIVHKVEPHELTQYLDIVECALLLPTLVQAGQQEEYSTTYLVRGDLPESARKLNITYEFKVDP
jgi:cytochrome c oxidase assembly protein Cox11